MPTTLKFKDAKKNEHIVVLVDEPEFPADEDEMEALAVQLAEKGASNLLAWAAEGTTKVVEPLELIAIED